MTADLAMSETSFPGGTDNSIVPKDCRDGHWSPVSWQMSNISHVHSAILAADANTLYLPSCIVSPPFGWYQFRLNGDRGMCVNNLKAEWPRL